MSRETTIRMANQIATFFETAADDDASAQIAGHINDFWNPRMRAELHELLAADSQPFNPLLVAGKDLIRPGSREPIKAD